MIAMLDTSEDLDTCEVEIGCKVERLLSPLTGFTLESDARMYAMDNGAFGGLDIERFRMLLTREERTRNRCRFVAVPDVVGSARRTLEVFEHWRGDHQLSKWPLALVAQDGLENLTIPWRAIDAVFIGGSTQWKLGPHAAAVIKAANALSKWAHVGRVNTPGRFEHFAHLGADSIDGTGLARFSHMREAIASRIHQPMLFTDQERAA